MREWFFTALSEFSDFTDIVEAERLNAVSSLGVDPAELAIHPQDGPFAFVRFGTLTRGLPTAPVQMVNVDLTVHDTPGDYTRIDRALRAARLRLLSAAGEETANGWLLGLQWAGDGEDLFDDGFRSICRTATFTLALSGEQT